MSTKTLLVLSVSLLFLVGVALGYSIHTTPAAKKLLPTTSREQTFYDSWQQARLATSSPTVNFRVSANAAAHDYVYSVSNAGRAVGTGSDPKVFASVIDDRSQRLASTFNLVLSTQDQTTSLGLWKNIGVGLFQYAQGKARVSTDSQTAGIATMNTAASQLAALYNRNASQIPAATIEVLLTRVTTGMRQAVDATTNGVTVAGLSAEQQAAQNLGTATDMLVSGLVQQNPSKF